MTVPTGLINSNPEETPLPIVEISMLRGRTEEAIRLIADVVHDAMAMTYEVPYADRFQAIKQYERHELIFDKAFMGGPRTDEFLLIQITAGRPRPVATKEKLFLAITDGLKRHAGVDPEDVLIVLGNVELSDLSLGGGRPFEAPCSPSSPIGND